MTSELHLYWFAVNAGEEELARWRPWLSPHEQARADRYVNPEHGRRYAASHARLREILARRLGCHSAEVAYTRGQHGKPELAPELAQRARASLGVPLHFNLSHSGAYALVGLSDAELGVDIENVEHERRHDVLAIAHRFFTPEEAAWVEALAPAERLRGFARLWTCKEAFLKADGRGLGLPLRSCTVALGPERAELQCYSPPQSWWVQELAVAPGYAAAVVQRTPPAHVHLERL